MYTSVIGKRFLEMYNKEKKKEYSAQEFFEKEIFEKFYNHKKYFKWVVNSPFVQKLGMDESAKIKSTNDEPKIKLQRLITKIENEAPDSSFAIGYPAADLTFDTSGQVSNINLPIKPEEIFYSWIGAGFGIEVDGKQVLYIDKEELLWTIYNGWKEYRKYLNDPTFSLKGNEIDLWNTLWFDFNYSENNISPKLMITKYLEKASNSKVNSDYSIKSISWVSLIFLLSKIYPKEKLTIFSSRYIFDKQKYVTIGFVQINIPEILKFNEYFNLLFSKPEFLANKQLRNLYQTELSFQRACELGTIGLRAIQPKDLNKYIPSVYEKSLPKLKTDENSLINYSIYITWIIAMLNNKDLLELAEKLAKKLKEFIAQEKKVRLNRSHAVEKFLSSRNRKDIIDNISEIIKEDQSISEMSNELVNHIMLDIAPDNLTLFVTLIRFKYLANNV